MCYSIHIASSKFNKNLGITYIKLLNQSNSITPLHVSGYACRIVLSQMKYKDFDEIVRDKSFVGSQRLLSECMKLGKHANFWRYNTTSRLSHFEVTDL